MDKWTKREMLAMEIGGNLNARDYLKKIGKESFEGYKADFARKYVAQLEKKVQAGLQRGGGQDSPTIEEKRVEVQPKKEEPEAKKTTDEEPKKEQDMATTPIDKSQMKSKKFAVTFTPKYTTVSQDRSKSEEQEKVNRRKARRRYRFQPYDSRRHHL